MNRQNAGADAGVTSPAKELREELKAALAQAEAARERLEADLAEAVAALFTTVTDASKVDANRDEVSAKVDKARARCRELRGALLKSEKSVAITRSRIRVETQSKQADAIEERKPAARVSDSSDLSVQVERKEAPDQFRLHKGIYGIKHVLATSPIVRQTVGFSALTLAYLQYYYFEVQLQIASLPSIWLIPVLVAAS